MGHPDFGGEEITMPSLWSNTSPANKKIAVFLWNGDPNAKVVPRVGLLVFAFIFMLSAIYVLTSLSDGSIGIRVSGLITGLVFLFVSLRFLRNTFIRSARQHDESGHKDSGSCW
jgi:hypothetical protein